MAAPDRPYANETTTARDNTRALACNDNACYSGVPAPQVRPSAGQVIGLAEPGGASRSASPYWVTPVLAADAGQAWLEFGRPDLAEQNLAWGLKLFGETQPRNRLLHCMSLAEARLACDDVEGAAEAAHSALELIGRFDSRRARIRLRPVAEGFGVLAGRQKRCGSWMILPAGPRPSALGLCSERCFRSDTPGGGPAGWAR
jgi:hypothetical protein